MVIFTVFIIILYNFIICQFAALFPLVPSQAWLRSDVLEPQPGVTTGESRMFLALGVLDWYTVVPSASHSCVGWCVRATLAQLLGSAYVVWLSPTRCALAVGGNLFLSWIRVLRCDYSRVTSVSYLSSDSSIEPAVFAQCVRDTLAQMLGYASAVSLSLTRCAFAMGESIPLLDSSTEL